MPNIEQNKLHIVALLDGRPGHEKQTKGIVGCLQSRVPIELTSISIKRPTPLQRVLKTCMLFLPHVPPPPSSLKNCDLLIGTGSSTHLDMLLLKKKLMGVPACTCMAPDWHLRSRFDLCFVPIHDGIAESRNIFLTAGAPNCSRNKKMHKDSAGLILLGGTDPKSHLWLNDRIIDMVRSIITGDAARRWTIASSPRTPSETVTGIAQLSAEFNNAQFVDYRETVAGWIEDQYDSHSVAWVTADSISMLYEALTAGCRVGILPLPWRNSRSKFARNEDLLVKKGLVLDFESFLKNNCNWANSGVAEFNEAQRCAERILREWWPENLR